MLMWRPNVSCTCRNCYLLQEPISLRVLSCRIDKFQQWSNQFPKLLSRVELVHIESCLILIYTHIYIESVADANWFLFVVLWLSYSLINLSGITKCLSLSCTLFIVVAEL